MSTSAVGSSSGSVTNKISGFGNISSDQFVKILVTELRQQDPFNPQDSSKLLEQLSSLRNVESQMLLQDKLTELVDTNKDSQTSLIDKLNSLVLQSQLSSAGQLIGREVAGKDSDNNSVSGLVTSVRVDQGVVSLELDTGKLLPFDNVTQVAQALAAEDQTSDDSQAAGNVHPRQTLGELIKSTTFPGDLASALSGS
ncbi:MAG: hypothetical protein IT443_01380 [Phycisphaeraceae bacterium]|nr:hypothetical protein [Phycisphaeraceae bacterium]